MGGCDMGGVQLGGGGERFYGCVIAHHKIEDLAEEMRILGGRAQGLGSDSAFGQE